MIMEHYPKRYPCKPVNLIIFCVMCGCCSSVMFNEVTDVVFHDLTDCVIAAFGDFNSDKLTDIFCLQGGGRTVKIFISQNPEMIRSSHVLSCTVSDKETITSVMPGDFNGDSMLDLLITVSKESSPTNEVRILWGSLDKINCTSFTNFSSKSQPLLIDYNGDMIPDMFGENADGKHFWSVDTKSLVIKEAPKMPSKQGLSIPHSCAFLDLNSDLEADLFVTGKSSLEYWYRTSGGMFNLSKEIDYPKDYKLHGQSLFVDINGDGVLEHVMPVCQDKKCSVMVRSIQDSDWKVLYQGFSFRNESWHLTKFDSIFKNIALPVALRSADFDMDGMPDFLTVVANEADTENRALLLKNVPCSNCPFGRTLLPHWSLLNTLKNVVIATFYDLFEDGIIDIVVNTKTGPDYRLHAFQNLLTTDAYFIKVLVVGGLCYDACPEGNGQLAYGINQPGPLISYRTTGPDGSPRVSAATQLSQAAHFALQLPYSIFGLGQTPNFVDDLQVVVPGGLPNEPRQHSWTQIIPNSQIVVIPFPTDNPKFWLAKLFVTPSHSILLTFCALVGTCLFICLIIGILHWKERRADRQEKLLEAHRFHFDAM